MNPFFVPLAVLGTTATLLGASGLGELWTFRTGGPALPVLTVPLSGAIQLAWILAVLADRRPALATAGWLAGLVTCRLGLNAAGFGASSLAGAAALEGLTLLVARALRPSVALAETLARWQRARLAVTRQLQNEEGLVPWLSSCCGLLLRGSTAHAQQQVGPMAGQPPKVMQDVPGEGQTPHSRPEREPAASPTSTSDDETVRSVLAFAARFGEDAARMATLPAAEREALARLYEDALVALLNADLAKAAALADPSTTQEQRRDVLS